MKCGGHLSFDPDSEQCMVCLNVAKCMKLLNDKDETYKRVLQWGKQNIIGKYTYSNPAFGNETATFVKNSFTENMGKGDLFYAKKMY